jgi:hypothetical protein
LFIKTMKSAGVGDTPFVKKPQADIGQLLKQIMIDPSFRNSIIKPAAKYPTLAPSLAPSLAPGSLSMFKPSPQLLVVPKPKSVMSVPPKTPVWNGGQQTTQISTKVSDCQTPIAQSRKNSTNEDVANNN